MVVSRNSVVLDGRQPRARTAPGRAIVCALLPVAVATVLATGAGRSVTIVTVDFGSRRR